MSRVRARILSALLIPRRQVQGCLKPGEEIEHYPARKWARCQLRQNAKSYVRNGNLRKPNSVGYLHRQHYSLFGLGREAELVLFLCRLEEKAVDSATMKWSERQSSSASSEKHWNPASSGQEAAKTVIRFHFLRKQ